MNEEDADVGAAPAWPRIAPIRAGAKPADLPVQNADQIRAGGQSENRQVARPRSAGISARPEYDRFVRRCRREGNKVKPLNSGALDAFDLATSAVRATTRRSNLVLPGARPFDLDGRMLPKSRLPKELYSASALNVSYWRKSGRNTNGQTSSSLTHSAHRGWFQIALPRCLFWPL